MKDLRALLRPEIQDFIRKHTGDDTVNLALKPNPFPDTDYPSIIRQIAARTKAKDKLPEWFATENIVYPSKVSVEQTSSEATASYKAALVSGRKLADLTGGFGVDSYYFSKKVEKVFHLEHNPELSEIAAHNFKLLGADNIECIAADSSEWLEEAGEFDWLYIDPSRRNDVKGKVFLLKDCLPDVPGSLDVYFRHTDKILIKTAPLLDIAAGIEALHVVKEIHIVAVENEVKELLWVLEKNCGKDAKIKTINLSKSGNQVFDFSVGKEVHPAYGAPSRYLYEANAAIMKAAGNDALAVAMGIGKIAPHSQLLTSAEHLDFPGRRFEILDILPYSKTGMAVLKGSRANVTTRNFPETVESIRKKWKITDGGDRYCFFTTDSANRKIVLLCAKIEKTG